MKMNIPYGKRSLEFSLPSDRLIGILHNKDAASRKDVKQLFYESLSRDNNRAILAGRVAGKDNILLAVSDATRNAHLREILPLLLKEIGSIGRTIDIIIATGMHKKHNRGQMEDLLGAKLLKRCRVLSHEQRKDSFMDLGETGDGVPIVLNKILNEYEAVISAGVIEPHLYAGYSGGAKTIAIGLAGEETINATHSLRFLDNPGTRIGSVEHNPFQDALWEIARGIPVVFSVNVVNDPDGRALKIFSGPTKKVFADGVGFARKIFEISAKRAADIVICGVGYPKDVNLYQVSRAINYILNVDRPVLKKGGTLIVAAEMADGAGDGRAEKRFYEKLGAIRSLSGFVKKVKREGCIAGVHRAYMAVRPLLDYHVIFVTGRSNRKLMEGLPFPCFEDMSRALSYAEDMTGKTSSIYVVPRALSIIPRRN